MVNNVPTPFLYLKEKNSLGHIKMREIFPTSQGKQKEERQGKFYLGSDGGSKEINTFMCFLWSNTELESGICFKRDQNLVTLSLWTVEACG